MGACEFMNTITAKTAEEAFNEAVEKAQHMYGHGGYTGTIAEKGGFRMINVPKDQETLEYAKKLLNDENHWVGDKHEAAGCILLGIEEVDVMVEPPPKRTDSKKIPVVGVRKWRTVYIIRENGVLLPKIEEKTQKKAWDLAKELALRNPDKIYEIEIMKLPDGHNPVAIVVRAVRNKPVMQKMSLNNYLFFGCAEE